MIITCVVVYASGPDGRPGFERCTFSIPKSDVAAGKHLEYACRHMRSQQQFDEPYIVFDDTTAPDWLMDYTSTYRVVVDNIGEVYYGNDVREARNKFDSYVEQSRSLLGRAGGKSVYLLKNEEQIDFHIGVNDL